MKVSVLIAAILLVSTALAEIKKIDSESEYKFPSGSVSKFSQGWSYDDSKGLLVSPENDLKVYFVEIPVKPNDDLEKLSLTLWKKADSNFNFKVFKKTFPPATNGWEKVSQISYEVPTKEARLVLSIIRIFKGVAYVNLVDGSNAGLDRRGAQFNIAVRSWQPVGLQREELGRKTAKKWTDKEQKEFFKFAKDLATRLDIPGVSLAVVQEGKLLATEVVGVKTLGKKDPIKVDTPFMIASITKPLNTLMLSKLVEQKKVKWETPVHKALPGFSFADKKFTSNLLLKHTSCACTGMPRRDLEFIFVNEYKTGEESIKKMSSYSPTTDFGETFQYSNDLVALGGYAGARVYSKEGSLNQAYEKVMQDLVFSPLDMKHSFVLPSKEIKSQLPSPHAFEFGGKMVPMDQKIDDMIYSVAPAGAVWSTAEDLARYISAELSGGKDSNGKQVFDTAQIKLRRTPGIKSGDKSHYGLGLSIEDRDGLEIVGHGGNMLGFTSDLFFIPRDQLGLVVLTNAGSANAYRSILQQKFLEMFYGAEVKSAEIADFVIKQRNEAFAKTKDLVSSKSKDTKWIEQYVGKYQTPELGVFEIKKTDKGFVLDVGTWSTRIGSMKEANGDKLLALLDAPWGGGGVIAAEAVDGKRKLSIDSGQVKYELKEIDVK